MPPALLTMVDLAARHRRVAEAAEAAVLGVLRSGIWVGGPEVAALEAEAATAFGRAHGVACGSGTDALVLALEALGVGPGDEVIVPALSFYATAGAVLLAGARPVVADVLPDRPLLDPRAAADAVGERTRAAIRVHLFGMACPDPELRVPLVEDSAQAAGLDPAPRLGVATAVSFYATKTWGAAGDGGLVASDDAEFAARVRQLANHGALPGRSCLHGRVSGHGGGNSRLDALQAALLRVHLRDLPARIARRRSAAAAFDAALPPTCRPVPRDAGDPIHQYLLRCEARDALAAFLHTRGIETAIYYPRPLSAQPALQPQPPTPVADGWCREVLSLPCHESLSDRDVTRIAGSLAEFRP
ncbi:MAG: aminotransferase class I/II-fold pyridoxal phosphate-dependent enzyme [Deltaproteobacteria bacterium]|nr:aminotransferase class I/II-fold pyridoxal phosphate-dependent enzyme [Deltaproteobacteria bacterium]